ncbi:endonuclease/exonuclease/phosphatase family protein [Rhizorhabdus sp. FW153]|uniref:endonuclease/exonuclease/phosphatase family protein n=1 Tax=Rhizorhabdus sp. FW153 TaxID=3400216 RepID=UPI003CECEFCC
MKRPLIAALALAALALMGKPTLGGAPALPPMKGGARPEGDGALSVMTYNVEGLPWPIRLGREAAFRQIGDRLATLRRQGAQPHIVLLQEAFTEDARAIGRQAGYRFVVDGPGPDLQNRAAPTPADAAFLQKASFFAGERSGKLLGSGLQILSDYPVRSIRRMAFPDFACAGFDCLANKGAVLAMIDIPGSAVPVAVVDVHLNSRRASHVDDDRSLYAFERQVDALEAFLTVNLRPDTPLILAGDFNVGPRPSRTSYFLSRLHELGSHVRSGMHDALRSCATAPGPCGGPLSADAAYSLKRARDWEIVMPGSRMAIDVAGISVPFGHDAAGDMLSDHVGYIAHYRLRSLVADREAQSRAGAAHSA